MVNFQPQLGIFFLIGIIMLILTGSGFVFLLRLKEKSRSSQMMLRFFQFASLSALATILTNLDQVWSWAFAPAQDAFLILSGIYLARFAYMFPDSSRSRESRLVQALFMVLATLALGYSFYFGVEYLWNLAEDLDELQVYYLLTPLSVLILAAVMFRRSYVLSAGEGDSIEKVGHTKRSFVSALVDPATPEATGLRNLGIALLIAVLPLGAYLFKDSLPILLYSFVFNLSIVISISAIIIAYLNMAVEYKTVMAKLVGISLVTVLLLLGGTCITLLHFFVVSSSHTLVVIFSVAAVMSAVFILGIFPIFFRGIITEPLSSLLEGVRIANKGDLDVSVQVKYHDELGYLTKSFNSMISSLREMSAQLQNKADGMEKVNIQQAEELGRVNEQLNQQLSLESALANCSRILLVSAESQVYRQQLLYQALEILGEAVFASRAYVFEFFHENGSEMMRMVAEACDPDIPPQIDNPTNQRFPVADLPDPILAALEAGDQIQGPTEKLFRDHPLREDFLSQDPPLLSVALFPIFIEGDLWGNIGFDDCLEPREWSSSAINFLGIASEIISNTIKRWQISDQLNATMDALEEKVNLRTQTLKDSNLKLRDEILQRRHFQDELEHRLDTERILARSAALLVESGEFEGAIQFILNDIAQILTAGSVSLIFNRYKKGLYQPEHYQWKLPQRTGLDQGMVEKLLDVDSWMYSQINSGDPVIIWDIEQLPEAADDIRAAAVEREIKSFAVWPLIAGDIILGLLLICNTDFYNRQIKDTFDSLALFVKILSGVLEREGIVQNLESKVTEQTREISTLYEITLQGSNSTDLPEILYPGLLRVQEIGRSDASCVFILKPDRQELELISQNGLPAALIKEIERIPLEAIELDWLNCTDPDYGPLSQFQEDIPQQLKVPGFESFFISRLRALNSTTGLLVLYRKDKTTFSTHQISILAIVGELLGTVVKNVDLVSETKNLATIDERQRLARDLHDAVSQSLYSISLFARSARDAQEDGDHDKMSAALVQLEESSLSALREMRLLLYQLRSIALEDDNLEEAILARVNMVERRVGIIVRAEIDQELILDEELEQDLFRITIEALNNSLRYAEANQVQIMLASEQDELILSIQDDGVGFIEDQVQSGMGLENIRERAALYGGVLLIDSSPGKGTGLQVRIPERPLNLKRYGS